jgi:hypothetical protein
VHAIDLRAEASIEKILQRTILPKERFLVGFKAMQHLSDADHELQADRQVNCFAEESFAIIYYQSGGMTSPKAVLDLFSS